VSSRFCTRPAQTPMSPHTRTHTSPGKIHALNLSRLVQDWNTFLDEVTSHCEGIPAPVILCILLEKHSTVKLCPPVSFWRIPGVILLFTSCLPLLQLHPLFELFCQCRLVVCIVASNHTCQINSHRLV